MKLLLITGINSSAGKKLAIDALNEGGIFVIGIDKQKYPPDIVKKILDSTTDPIKNASKFDYKLINLTSLMDLEHYLVYSLPSKYDMRIFSSAKIIHCATFKSPPTNIRQLKYYSNNIMTTVNMLDVIERKVGIFNIIPIIDEFVFHSVEYCKDDIIGSSSSSSSPDVKSLAFCEEIIKDYAASAAAAADSSYIKKFVFVR